MKMPRRRYIVATVIFVLAGAGMLEMTEVTWPIVALVATAAIVVLGAHAFDGLKAGPLEIDPDDQETA